MVFILIKAAFINSLLFHNLWTEYEEQFSYENKFIKALDKLEAFIQHNEAKFESWEYQEKEYVI
jgi:5'-deoxynucleotidase YfbR-like HD superfamily hydrolase